MEAPQIEPRLSKQHVTSSQKQQSSRAPHQMLCDLRFGSHRELLLLILRERENLPTILSPSTGLHAINPIAYL
eukprot:755592-Hanusia_phi.AAC.3